VSRQLIKSSVTLFSNEMDEVDNIRKMVDNRKKIQKYLEMWPEIKMKYQNPKLCVFTHSEKRKKEFLNWTKNIPNEIHIFKEI